MKPIALLTAALAGWVGIAIPGRAQTPAPPPAPAVEAVSTADLDNWLAPIALYPDPLLAQVLAAATQPSDIVLADRYLSGGGDLNLLDQQPWDPSVKALARYPGVLKMMSDYLGWTTELGQVFLYQPPEVMDEVQRLRAQAVDLGNLDSTPQENVIAEDGSIEILPAEPDVVYVPDYQPEIVYSQHPVGAPCIQFGAGFNMGPWMDRDFDWHQRQLLAWDHIYPRPADWWSSRRPAPPAPEHPAQPGHSGNPISNPRTEPTHFVVWQVPRVRAVTSGDLAARGWDPRHVHPGHANHWPERPKAGGSSLIVLPAHSSGSAGVSPGSGSRLHVFSSATPAQTLAFSGGHHANGAFFGAESAHDTERFSHRGRESRETGSNAGHPSHGSAPSHSGGASHSSGGSGRH